MIRSRPPLAYVAVAWIVSAPVAAVRPIGEAIDRPVQAAVTLSVNAVDPRVVAAVEGSVRAAVDSSVNAAVERPVNAAVDPPANAAVERPVRAAVDSSVNAAVERPVNAAVAKPVEPPVLVFAAASLGSVLDEMKPAIERAAGTTVRVSYASSATLARQIEAGAPADVFISADVSWMHYLVGHGLVDGRSVVQIATNRLVLIAPARSTTHLSIAAGFPLREALGTGRLAVGDPASVPAGTYARSALEYFGVWDSVKDRLAPGENVRVALQFVARGECPLGIVYASDVKVEPGVRIVDTFPDESVRPGISYPGGLTTSRSNPAAARVLAFLQTREARRTLGRFGFIVEWPFPATP